MLPHPKSTQGPNSSPDVCLTPTSDETGPVPSSEPDGSVPAGKYDAVTGTRDIGAAGVASATAGAVASADAAAVPAQDDVDDDSGDGVLSAATGPASPPVVPDVSGPADLSVVVDDGGLSPDLEQGAEQLDLGEHRTPESVGPEVSDLLRGEGLGFLGGGPREDLLPGDDVGDAGPPEATPGGVTPAEPDDLAVLDGLAPWTEQPDLQAGATAGADPRVGGVTDTVKSITGKIWGAITTDTTDQPTSTATAGGVRGTPVPDGAGSGTIGEPAPLPEEAEWDLSVEPPHAAPAHQPLGPDSAMTPVDDEVDHVGEEQPPPTILEDALDGNVDPYAQWTDDHVDDELGIGVPDDRPGSELLDPLEPDGLVDPLEPEDADGFAPAGGGADAGPTDGPLDDDF